MKQYHKNPRQMTARQDADLRRWLREFGDLSGIVHDLNTDEIIGGNQRGRIFDIDQCEIEIAEGPHDPDEQGTVAHGYVTWGGARYAYRQVRWTPKQCEQANIIANKAGGTFDFDELANGFEFEDLLDWGFESSELDITLWDGEVEEPGNVVPNPRELPLDVIYTIQGADATCCLAVRAGLKYGIQSPRSTICPYCLRGDDNHKIAFIDNDFKNYDHASHVAMCEKYKPKYATVRDIMSERQCKTDGIKYYEFGEILDWAEEINEYADNVILIPKYDCIDKIPEYFMLGYSIPTSHGGTPLSIELFKGRKVHLLGGSWRKQLNYLAELGDDVISLDNNYIQRQARILGIATTPDGDEWQLSELKNTEKGFDVLTNPRYTALSISFGAIGAKINELYKRSQEPA